MKTKRKTRLFVARRDGDIAKLAAMCDVPQNAIFIGKKDREGDEYNVAEVDDAFIAEVEYCAPLVQLEYHLFIQRGGDTRMKRMPLREKKAHTPTQREGTIAKLLVREEPLVLSGVGRTSMKS